MALSDKLSPIFPYEPLTAEQVAKMDELARKIEGLPQCTSFVTEAFKTQRDVCVAKLLIARKWDVDNALKMVVDMTNFRAEKKLDELPLFPSTIPTRGYDQEALMEFHGRGMRKPNELDRYAQQLKNCYASSWHKWDKGFRPVYIERTGSINVKEIVKRCKQMVPPGASFHEPAIACHLHANEVGGVVLRYANANRPAGTPEVVQVSVVMDCSGFTLGHLFGPAMEILKAQSVMDQAYYPEGLHQLYVANAPTALSVGWNLVKGWLDPRVQKKVHIWKPSETRQKLLEVIDAQHLPEFLGGTCSCNGGCVGNNLLTAAAEDEEDDEFADNVVKTEVLKINARDKLELTRPVPANTQVAWEYHTEGKLDISFSATFTDATTGVTATVSEPVRQQTGNGQFATAQAAGTLTFVFDNTYSWMSKKTVCFLADATPLEAAS